MQLVYNFKAFFLLINVFFVARSQGTRYNECT